MLYSQGISLERLGITDIDGRRPDVDPRDAWSLFAANYHLFRGTPSTNVARLGIFQRLRA